MIQPAPGKKYDDFQLSYALDLLHGKMTVASAGSHAPLRRSNTPPIGEKGAGFRRLFHSAAEQALTTSVTMAR